MGRGGRETAAHESDLVHGDGLRRRVVITEASDYFPAAPSAQARAIADLLWRRHRQVLHELVIGIDALKNSDEQSVRELVNRMDMLMAAVLCQPRSCVTVDPDTGQRLLAYVVPTGELLGFASSDLTGSTLDERAYEVAQRVTELAGICPGK